MASSSKSSEEEAKGKKLPEKRKKVEDEEDSSSFSDESESEQSISTEDDEDVQNEQINVDFEGKDITKEDFHGIKMLLQRLLVTISVNISELADIIITQENIGSTLKVVEDDEGTVYGIITAVDLIRHKDNDCTKKLCKSLKDKCKQSSGADAEKLSNLFEKPTCLLINERFINIPGDVAAPMFSALRSEIKEAMKKGNLCKFDYFLLVTKSVKATSSKDQSSSKEEGSSSSAAPSSKKKMKRLAKNKEIEMQFINPEDELFYKNAIFSFSYCVTNATGLAISGEWEFGEAAMDTYRTVVIVESSRFNSIVEEIEKLHI